MKKPISSCLSLLMATSAFVLDSPALRAAGDLQVSESQQSTEDEASSHRYKRAWWDQDVSEYPEWETGLLKVGGFVASFDTSLQFSLQGVAGINIDAEDLLGLDSTLSVLRFDGLWRFGKRKRSAVDFTYSQYRRSAFTTIGRDVDLGNGAVIPIGATIESVFDFDLIRATYTHSIFRDSRMDLGLGLGVYVAPIRYGLTFTPTNGSPVGLDVSDATIPLPAIALRGQFRITPKLYLLTDLDFMYLSIDDFEGSLVDLRLGLEYQLCRYFGLGVAYNTLTIDVSAVDESDYIGNFVGNLDVNFGGMLFYGKFSF